MGLAALPGTLAFAARLAYEHTVLTWQRGPQIGFTLVHTEAGLFLLMVFSWILAHIFLLGVLIVVCSRLIRRRSLPSRSHAVTVIAFLCVALIDMPEAAWDFALIRIAGPGSHGPEHLSEAAALGNRRTVRLLLTKGVPVDSLVSGRTALNAACATKQVEIGRYLLSKGADLKQAPACMWLAEFNPAVKLRPHVPGETIEVH